MKNFNENTSLWIHFAVWTVFYGIILFILFLILGNYIAVDTKVFFADIKYEYIFIFSLIIGAIVGGLYTSMIDSERKGKIFRKEVDEIYVILKETTDMKVLEDLYNIKMQELRKKCISLYQITEINTMFSLIEMKYNTLKQIKEKDFN